MKTSQRLNGRRLTAALAALPAKAVGAQTSGQRVIASGFRLREVYAKGVELFAQGQTLSDVYWLDCGLVKLVYCDAEGHERILALLPPQRLLGGATALLHCPSPVSAVTVTVCQLRRMAASDFVKSLESDGPISREVLYLQSQEVHEQFDRIADLSTGSSRLRLERFLRGMVTASPAASGTPIRIPLKRCELAQLLAVTPEHLSRLFRQLCNDRVIALERGWLIVHALGRLAGATVRCADVGAATRIKRLSA
jgi:CRP-like cAMP-binding protein